MASKIWNQCRICGNPNLVSVIDMGKQPLSGVFPKPSEPDPSSSPLDLVRCDISAKPGACGLVQLRDTADLGEMYGSTYGYFSSISPTMTAHLTGKVHDLVAYAKPRRGDIILDIGSNDGTLLNAYGSEAGFVRVGMDPSAEKFRHNYQSDINVVYDFFSEKGTRSMIGGKSCKIITSIAMFYDLDDPLSFVRQIRALLAVDGVWALELAYMPLFLKQLSYDQICHEHVTYYGLRQMDWMMRQEGLKILNVSFNDMNGGSFYLYVGRADGPYIPEQGRIDSLLASEAELDLLSPYQRLRNRMLAHRDDVKNFFKIMRAAGKKVYGYGASTKGNVVINYCGLGPDDVVAIGDRNPEKDGRVTPGARIPIISHEKLRALKPEYLFVFIWHFRSEVIRDEMEFLRRGGTLVFSLPRLHLVDINNYDRYLDNDFRDQSFLL